MTRLMTVVSGALIETAGGFSIDRGKHVFGHIKKLHSVEKRL